MTNPFTTPINTTAITSLSGQNFLNGTEPDGKEETWNSWYDPGFSVVEVFLMLSSSTLASLFTVAGNLLVILAFMINRQLRTINNYLIINLALADLMIGICSMNLYTVMIIQGGWYMGDFLCQFWLILDYVCSQTSSFNLLIICVDRYLSVQYAVWYRNKRSVKHAISAMISVWTLSILIWAVPILLYPTVSQLLQVDEAEPILDRVFENQTFINENDLASSTPASLLSNNISRISPTSETSPQQPQQSIALIPTSSSTSPPTCVVPFLSESKTLTVLTALIAFYIPAAIMSMLYFKVYTGIFSRRKNLSKMEGEDKAGKKGRKSKSGNEPDSDSDDENLSFKTRISRRYSSFIVSLKKDRNFSIREIQDLRQNLSMLGGRLSTLSLRRKESKVSGGNQTGESQGKNLSSLEEQAKPRKISNYATESSQITESTSGHPNGKNVVIGLFLF